MRNQITIARPYANAVFLQAKAKEQLVKWSDMLQLLKAVINDDNLQNIIRNPRLSTITLAKLICDVCGEKLDQSGRNFVHILTSADRLMLIADIQTLFHKLYSKEQGVIDIDLYSAYPMTEDEQNKISMLMDKRLGKQTKLYLKVDPSLIGGIIIAIEDLVMDLSIKGRLKTLQNEFCV